MQYSLKKSNFHRYFIIALVFAGVYYAFSPRDTQPTSLASFGHAFVAALQIQSTIGFAAPSEGHWSKKPGLVIAITIHGLTTVLFNVFLLGTLFARMSSAKNRAISVRVSSSAVIRENPGSGYPMLEFRVGEIRKHQLMNLRVSAFLLSHKGEKLFYRENLALDPPEGVFLAIPTEIRHIISETSPLWNLLRQGLGTVSNFDCPVCGDTFTSRSSLIKHSTFMSEVGGDARHGEAISPLKSLPLPSVSSIATAIDSNRSYWEIMILVEGTEPITGSPIQVRHSFLARDIKIGETFEKCWSVETGANNAKKIVVDFKKFDNISSNSYP